MNKYIRLDQLADHFPVAHQLTVAAVQAPAALHVSPKMNSAPKPHGFVVLVTSRRMTGFLAWAETSVFDLSPHLRDAWKFPSRAAAHQAVARAIGPAAAKLNIAVVSWSQP